MPPILLGGVLLPATVIGSGVVLTPRNPPTDGLLIEPPDPPDANGGDLTLSGILTDGDLVELEILGEFICGHDLGHEADIQR